MRTVARPMLEQVDVSSNPKLNNLLLAKYSMSKYLGSEHRVALPIILFCERK